MDVDAVSKGKGQPEGNGTSKGTGESDKGKGQPKVKARAKGKEKPVSQRARRIRNLIASVLFCGEIGHFAKDCDHRVRTVNEVNQAAPVSTPVSAVTDPHTLSHVYKQNISVEHNWILALTVDIHSCSHVTASNMRLGTISPHLSTKQVSLKNVGGDVLHHFGSKTECYVYRSVKFQVNYEVAPVARPILSVDIVDTQRSFSRVWCSGKQFIHPIGLMDTKFP